MFKEINIDEIKFNVFNKLNNEWALVTANNNNKVNTMTISWGGFGVIWNKNVATIYIRNSRYTKKIIDSSNYFTISFYDDKYRDKLKYLGTTSGEYIDKIKNVNFNTVIDNKVSYFKEANMVIICKKIYKGTLESCNFLDGSINNNYKDGDYHTMYIGEIEKILIKN